MKLGHRIVAISLGLVAWTCSWASDADDDAQRLSNASQVLAKVATAPNGGIPMELLARAKCIIVIPNLVKAGFVIGGKYGRGVATCRTGSGAEGSGNARARQAVGAQWSAPAFVTLGGGSVGLQIGAEGMDLVMLVMNDQGLQQLLSSKLEVSVEGSVAAGSAAKDSSVAATSNINTQILIYSLSKGIFAGQTLEGAMLEQDAAATKAAYGSNVPFEAILAGRVPAPSFAAPFLQSVSSLSHQAGTEQAR